jgi:hypothetical protein
MFNEQNVSSTVSTSPQGLGQAAGPGNVRLGLQPKNQPNPIMSHRQQFFHILKSISL